MANAVIRIASLMNMPVTAVEDREEFAKMAEENGASQVICMPFSKALKQAEFTKDTYCLIMTRGHLYDKECLEYILRCRYGYLGLMGSRKRVAKLKTEMEEKGFDKKKLDEIHMPVGLNIHAETPTEIAVSIMAEIISLKNQNDRSVFYEKPVAEYLFSPDFRNESSGENKGVLITIIGKKGSAPREAGTKMIVTRSGRLLGTIGGGYLEAEGIRQAEKYLMRQGWESDTINICISSDNAAREGMYCGGEVELLLEGLV